MPPRIEGFVTREQAGLALPKSFSDNITPQHGGSVAHWGGLRQWIGNHNRCLEIWYNWQRFHMGRNHPQPHASGRHWVDIAYTGAFCNHGYALAGRGFFVRTAANGTNKGNQNNYAFVWIGGQGDPPSNELAFDAFEWWVHEARRVGKAGKRVRNHTEYTGSACPGPRISAHTRKIDNRDLIVVASIPKPKPEPKDPFDLWWDSMNADQRKVLEDFANEILEQQKEHGTNGRSFARNLLKQFRDIRDALKRVENPDVSRNPTIQSVFVGGINVIDAVRDLGYKIDTTERTGPVKNE